MGADWVGYAVPIARPRDEALSLLDAMPIDEIVKRNDEFGTVLAMNIEDGDYDIEHGDIILLDDAQVRSRCREAVNIAYDCAEGKYRLASWVKQSETLFAIAGGASWGDTPEYVDDLCIADALRVTYDETKELRWVDKAVHEDKTPF